MAKATLREPGWVTQWSASWAEREDGVIAAIVAKEFDDSLPLKYRVLTFNQPYRSINVDSFEEASHILTALVTQQPDTAVGRPGWDPK